MLSLPVIIPLSIFFNDCAFYTSAKEKQFKRLFVYEILYRQLTSWKLNNAAFVTIFSPACNVYSTKDMIVEIEFLFADALVKVNEVIFYTV